MMTTYVDALKRLCQPVRQGDYPASLRPMQALLGALGDPHLGLRAVVVTGSTGKGTTCARIAGLLGATGLRVGLYTSPHLHSFRERFVLNGEIISQAAFVTGAEAVSAAAVRPGRAYSTFEQATALALWWFAQQQADLVVLEIGIGGRWDAVNVVENVLAVFTPIEAEHLAMLGGSLESVAWHKAGIIQPNGYALTVEQMPVVYAALAEEAQSKQAHLRIIENGNLPLAACQFLMGRGLIPTFSLPETEFAGLPGRLEHVTVRGREMLIDGGHTPLAARHLRDEIIRLAGETEPVRLIVGLLNDKNARAYLEAFDSPRFHIVLTRPPGHRAVPPKALASQAAFQYAAVEIVPDLGEALAQVHHAPEPLVVAAGSLRMAAAAREVYGLLSPTILQEAAATRDIFEGVAYLSKLPPMAQTGSSTPAE